LESPYHGSGECEPVTSHEWAPPAGQASNDNDTHQSQPRVFSGPGFVIMVIAFKIVIVLMVLMVSMTMMIMVMLIVHCSACRAN
jgi:hypothetical protein